YEALPYVWGTEDAKIRVPVVESAFPSVQRAFWLRPNVHEALKCLRSPDKIRIMWVDALCINQEDWNERSSEVKRTDIIYKLAHSCSLAWSSITPWQE
ncbi:hypothetical protein K458DRAFT_317482, partial [Lentithecium fluviatile CBS 122367]